MAWEKLIRASSTVIPKRQLITSDASWPVPEKVLQGSVKVTLIGGGSSGNSASTVKSGGNGGQYLQRYPVDVSAVTSVSCTIGQGGAPVDGAGTDTAGNPGAPTSFGSLVTVLGGVAPSLVRERYNDNNGGALGRASSGNTAYPVTQAQSPMGIFGALGGAALNANNGAGGGGLLLDGSGTGGETVDDSATGGAGYGAGGGPSLSNNIPSGAGAPGAILIEWLETP